MKKRLTLLTLAAILILATLISACNTHADIRGADVSTNAPKQKQHTETESETEQTFAEDASHQRTMPEPDLLTMYREFLNGERSAEKMTH